MNGYYELIEAMHRTQALSELHSLCDEALNGLGIFYYKYQWQPSPYLLNSPEQSIIACPPPWMEHYQRQGFGGIDPKVKYAHQGLLPVVWDPQVIERCEDEQERRFWQHSHDFGLGHGVTIPIRSRLGGRGMFCLALPNEQADRRHALERLPEVETMVSHLQSSVERLLHRQEGGEVALTRREAEIVKWTAYGKTAAEIGIILGISAPTVLFHLKNAKQKMRVVNKHQLTARALAFDLI